MYKFEFGKLFLSYFYLQNPKLTIDLIIIKLKININYTT